MDRHQQVWRQAVADLNRVQDNMERVRAKLAAEQQELERRVAQIQQDIKYSDGNDRYHLLQELNQLQQREQEAKSQLCVALENAGSPYFAKIVSEDAFYISKYFCDIDNNIVKYTAPIAALRYRSPGETVTVNGFRHQIREKQLVKIENSKLVELNHFDSQGSFVCDAERIRALEADELAREIPVSKGQLNQPAPPQVREEKKYVLGEIIAKMREEQDQVMRAPYRGITLVKGAAGSGKTNIAFHRIVYLVSEHPDRFRQHNVAVFCYNVALKQYLSNMLAELNIPRVKVFSLDEWFYSVLRAVTNIGWLEYKTEEQRTRYIKTRLDMVEVLDQFYERHRKQLQQMVEQEEVEGERELRIDAYAILNLLYTHQPFLDRIGCSANYSRGRYKAGSKVDSADQYLLAWLIHRLTEEMGINCFGSYDHIVVDEVQDVAPLQMALINELHNDSMTLVGDVTQRIFDGGVDSWDQFNLKIDRTHELTMCHRSTLETVLFANQLLSRGGENMFSTRVGKQGEKPCVYLANTRTQALIKTVERIRKLKEQEPEASVVVAHYRKSDLNWIHSQLVEAGLDAYIASRKDWEFSPRISVTTYHQIKGLEFDYVFVLGLNDFESSPADNRERVVYTVVTRAQKRVFVAGVKTLPEMVKKVDQELYDLEQ